jgi:hypothetical protein
MELPEPPDELMIPAGEPLFEGSPDEMPGGFRPSPELWQWTQETLLTPESPLYNEEHWHLTGAPVGVLWTNVEQEKRGVTVAGTAEVPFFRADWGSQRARVRLIEWFGSVPCGLITLYAPYWASVPYAAKLSLLEHEMYHLAIRTSRAGEPMFDPETGEPRLRVAAHDVEEFVGVVRRYGAGNAAGLTQALVGAASRPAEIAEATIRACCGTCG